jgi:indolepyruvate ferredoxin oxidoreductase
LLQGGQPTEQTLSVGQVVKLTNRPDSLAALRDHRANLLTSYQDARYARRYNELVNRVHDVESRLGGSGSLAKTVARCYYKLLAYKDEYEVARLYSDGVFLRDIERQFEGAWSLQFHLAPPLFSKKDSYGHLIKKPFGPQTLKVFKLLASFKFLRGTFFDPFGHTTERKAERALIREYETLVEQVLSHVSVESLDAADALLSTPDEIRGYGHVKAEAMSKAKALTQSRLKAFNLAVASKDIKRAA